MAGTCGGERQATGSPAVLSIAPTASDMRARRVGDARRAVPGALGWQGARLTSDGHRARAESCWARRTRNLQRSENELGR